MRFSIFIIATTLSGCGDKKQTPAQASQASTAQTVKDQTAAQFREHYNDIMNEILSTKRGRPDSITCGPESIAVPALKLDNLKRTSGLKDGEKYCFKENPTDPESYEAKVTLVSFSRSMDHDADDVIRTKWHAQVAQKALAVQFGAELNKAILPIYLDVRPSQGELPKDCYVLNYAVHALTYGRVQPDTGSQAKWAEKAVSMVRLIKQIHGLGLTFGHMGLDVFVHAEKPTALGDPRNRGSDAITILVDSDLAELRPIGLGGPLSGEALKTLSVDPNPKAKDMLAWAEAVQRKDKKDEYRDFNKVISEFAVKGEPDYDGLVSKLSKIK